VSGALTGLEDKLTKTGSLIMFCLKIDGIILIVDFLILVLSSVFLGRSVVDLDSVGFLSVILFVECGVVLIAGGATEMSSSVFFSKVREYVFHSKETWSADSYRKGREKAVEYILLGIMLFAESMVLALLI